LVCLFNPVEQEAARIKLGEYFLDFKEFDRCLRSWSVLNGRGYYKYATKPRFRVRVCRFGKTSRSKIESKAFIEKAVFNATVGAFQESFQELWNNKAHFGAFDKDHRSASSSEGEDDDSNSAWNVVDGILVKAPTAELSKNAGKENCCIQLPKARQTPLPENSTPLMTLNTMNNSFTENKGEPAQMQIQPSKGKRMKSVILHHSKWLPRGKKGKSGRNIPESGAYGELLRIPEGYEIVKDSQTTNPCPFWVRAAMEKKSGKIKITICDVEHSCALYKHK
jgi:hypothetical protein